MKKEYKTVEQQIERLKDVHKLNIVDEINLKQVLMTCNYQKIINGYNDVFFKKPSEHPKIGPRSIYLSNITEKSILSFFIIDLQVADFFWRNIQIIESTLNTAIALVIGEVLINNNECEGRIIKILKERNENKKLLSKLFQFKPSNYSSKINYNNLSKEMTRYFKGSDNLVKHYSESGKLAANQIDYTSIPIWSLCIYWSFGTSLSIFNNLTDELKDKVRQQSFFKDFPDNYSLNEFLEVIHLIRNRICHNNSLYMISKMITHKSRKVIINFLKSKGCEYKTWEISLYHVAKVIDCIIPTKLLKNEMTKLEEIESSIINNKNFPYRCKRKILLYYGFNTSHLSPM